MIGRAASSNPWIFAQIQEYLATGAYRIPAGPRTLRADATLLQPAGERGEPDAIGKMKQFATYFTHGIRNGSKLGRRSTRRKKRRKCSTASTRSSAELEAAVA